MHLYSQLCCIPLTGPSGRLQLKSVQPHVIMGNVEKLMYRNDLKEATAELKRFFEQLHFQSHPNSEHFKTCAESVFEKRNPLRRALFLAAYACKGARENSNHEKTFDVAGQIFEIFDNLVKPLSGKEKDYAGVLDTNLLSKGAHAIDVAVCISRIMREIHEWGIADARHTGNSKTYSLRWIMASYEKTKHYTDAITFAKDKTSDYNGLHNENVVFIHTALGSCFRESSRYGEALTQYKKAKMSTKKILSEWDKEGVSKVEISQSSHEERAESRARLEKNLGFLHKYIGQVQRTLKRHSKASKLGTKAEV